MRRPSVVREPSVTLLTHSSNSISGRTQKVSSGIAFFLPELSETAVCIYDIIAFHYCRGSICVGASSSKFHFSEGNKGGAVKVQLRVGAALGAECIGLQQLGCSARTHFTVLEHQRLGSSGASAFRAHLS